MADERPGADWYKGIVTPIIAWGAIGIITGAGWLAFFVPSRLGQVDNNQKLILSQLDNLEKKLEAREEAYQNLRDRLTRLESGRPE